MKIMVYCSIIVSMTEKVHMIHTCKPELFDCTYFQYACS